MKRLAALLATALLVALPLVTVAQGEQVEVPPAGAVVIVAYQSDGDGWLQVPGGIAVPPIACQP